MTWYLRTSYRDPRRGEVRERHYLDNGEVWLVIDGDRSLRGTFDHGQLEAARAAVAAARFPTLDDIGSTADDLAEMTYEWTLPGNSGRWVDAAYPAVIPESVDHLEEILLTLEEAMAEPDPE